MLTNFTPEQLRHPVIAEADAILRNCVHCGFCTATCPTFVLRGDELDSPRGRIMLIKEMHEKGGDPGETVIKHLDRCLTCLSCMTTCPSGVDYLHLAEGARQRIEASPNARPWWQRAQRGAVMTLLTHRGLFRAAMMAAALVKPLAPILPRAVARLLRAAPKLSRPAFRARIHTAKRDRKYRVALLTGCAQAVVGEEVNRAAIRLLTRFGAEVVTPEIGCCGALACHLGAEEEAKMRAADTVSRWWAETREGGGAGLDAVIITTSGCGGTVKDYGHLLRDDPLWAVPAAKLAALTLDISEWLEKIGFAAHDSPAQGVAVAYQASCSLQHGQKQKSAPLALLRAAGLRPIELRDSHLCCGSAGSYSILQPDLSQQLRERKQETLREAGADWVASANLGCILHLQPGLDAKIVHTVQLLDWASGGRKPEGVA